MKLSAFVFGLLIGCLVTSAPSEEMHGLFNGRDLTGWTRVNTAESTWRVRDGMLICTGKPIGELRTTKMYQNFILEVEWRHMKPGGNAGIFVWADDITARGVPFHRSIEVQVLENAYGQGRGHTTHGDIFPIHGATMTPINGRGGSRAFPTESLSLPSPQWNHYRVECRDGDISLAVNGKIVTRGKECSPRKGYICVESEGGVVHYRNMRIKELPDTPVNAKHIAIEDRGYRCIYEGIDLAAWNETGDGWRATDWRLRYAGDGPGELVTKEQFGDIGFAFDVQASDSIAPALFRVRGAEISIRGTEVGLARGWNRFEGQLQGNRLSYSINGAAEIDHEVDAAATGPISLRATGPIDFANIYVRSLD